MNLENMFRYYYLLLSFTLTWKYGKCREMDSVRDPPCYFNPLCSCSKAVPDLGIVRCQDVLLSNIPPSINSSKVFMLQLHNVGLRTISPIFLQNTGLYKLFITNNPLVVIPDDAFLGLERTLWKLDLNHNELLDVPSKALRYLQKLRYLDLTGNAITRVFTDSWKGLENSLETLILADNSITHIPPDTFTGLPALETLNLKGNNLRDIDPSIFREGMDRLAHIIFADNLLSSIPYLALSSLKMLKTLDLSYNRISRMSPTMESGNIKIQLDVRLSLDMLKLDYNQLIALEASDFQYFNVLNKTYLDGNPLRSIEENAFQQAKISELYIRSCSLTEILPSAFNGLENYLMVLDLSGNNLTTLANEFLINLKAIQTLSLGDNLLINFAPIEAINGFQHTLFNLDLSGIRNHPLSLQNLKRLRNLKTLYLSRLSQHSLIMDDFFEFGANLEELYINFGEIESIRNRAFQNIHGLKLLDLSENKINQIESEAMINIGHSLIILRLAHGFSTSVSTLPLEFLKVLPHLEALDLSNNKIKAIPEASFHVLRKLKILELQDNQIEQIHKGTFQGDMHSNLRHIYLSFNNIKSIQQHTFMDLDMLEQLHIDDNLLTSIERRSFMDLENLKRLNLKGNKIATVSYEAFQNLPELEDLDMSYNELTNFQFSVLDQVGTLATFCVNVSHNKLIELTSNNNYASDSEPVPDVFYANIKVFDFSFNNITQISKQYFRPIELSLTHLYASHNHILNISKDILGNMPHLQWLDLSFNRLLEFDYDTFKNSRNIQAIVLSHNYIAEVPKELFRFLFNLRIVDLSHNRIRFLSDKLFRGENLQRLDLSNNQLTRFSLSCLTSGAAATLSELDLSWNGISSITQDDGIFKLENLSWLDLSHNRLVQIEFGSILRGVVKLFSLDLSHNSQLSLERYGKSFQGVEDSLLYLKLDNLSLTTVPVLPLPRLVSLSLAQNSLSIIPQELATNLSSLRELNLADNDLTNVPIITHSLNNLKHLSLNLNPITILSNTSLLGVANHLEQLDIRDLPLNIFEAGALNKMVYLRSLKIGVYNNVKNYNIPRIIECNFGLRSLQIDVDKDTDLEVEMMGKLPSKLQKLSITGKSLKTLSSETLQGIRTPFLHFTIENSSLTKVPLGLFDNVHLQNLSLVIKNNGELRDFENPFSAGKPGLSRKAFVIDVQMNDNNWNCDCGLSWIEIWQRKRRQYLCDSNIESLPQQKTFLYTCRHVQDDIRNSICVNKANQSLVEVLKTDIECGWSSAYTNQGFISLCLLMIIGLVLTC